MARASVNLRGGIKMWLPIPRLRGLLRPGERFLEPRIYHRRRHWMSFFIVLMFSAALVRLGSFAEEEASQVWAAWTGAEAEAPRQPLTLALTADPRDRASILDAQGLVLATSIDVSILCHRPGEVSNPRATAAALAQIIPEANEARLAERLAGPHPWLTHEVSPRQQQQIHELYLEGITFCDDKRRVYPQGELFAHTVGFTDLGNQGLTGMEAALNLQIQNSQAPIQTSLDATIQSIVAQELAEQIEAFEAIGGVAILMNAHTAEVVSLVSLPTFDPASIRDVNDEALFNRATKGVYELGSVMKPFTVAAALNEGLINGRTQIDVTRNLQIDSFEIADFPGTPRGIYTVPQVIERSSNIGTARIADLLGPDMQQRYLGRFGFTNAVDIELAEIAAPLVPHTWGRIQTMTISYGHGISITPLQLVAAEAALVNGGLYRHPTLLSARGQEREARRVISEDTSIAIREMLRRVAVFGSGKNANAPGYVVGGKTGTADKSRLGSYAEDARIASFIGAFPIHDPQYVLLVSIDEPKPQEWTYGFATGGWVAAPVFGEIVQQIGPHLGIQRLEADPYGYAEPEPVRYAEASPAPEAAPAPVTPQSSAPRAAQAPSAAESAQAQSDLIDSLIASDGVF